MPEESVEPLFTSTEECARRWRGVRCERQGTVGFERDDGDVLWLCDEHLAELLRRLPQLVASTAHDAADEREQAPRHERRDHQHHSGPSSHETRAQR